MNNYGLDGIYSVTVELKFGYVNVIRDGIRSHPRIGEIENDLAKGYAVLLYKDNGVYGECECDYVLMKVINSKEDIPYHLWDAQ